MESPNQLTMKCHDRTAVFSMAGEGNIWFRESRLSQPDDRRDEVVINLETEQPAISGGVEYDCDQSIILSWIDSPFDIDHLHGRTIEIPQSYDETLKDHVTNFYYFEHLDFDDVRIRFVDRDGERFRIEVTGKAPNPTTDGDATMDIHIDTIVKRTDR